MTNNNNNGVSDYEDDDEQPQILSQHLFPFQFDPQTVKVEEPCKVTEKEITATKARKQKKRR